MVLKDLMKAFGVVTLSLILILLINFLKLCFIGNVFFLIVLTEIFKIIPVFIFSKRLLGLIVFSLIVGIIWGSVQGLMAVEENPNEPLPIIMFISCLTALISGISLYGYKRTQNPSFLVFLPVGLFFSILISYYFVVYRSWFLAILSPIFLSTTHLSIFL